MITDKKNPVVRLEKIAGVIKKIRTNRTNSLIS